MAVQLMYDPSGQIGACVQRLTTQTPVTSRLQHSLEATDAEDGAAAEHSVTRPTEDLVQRLCVLKLGIWQVLG